MERITLTLFLISSLTIVLGHTNLANPQGFTRMHCKVPECPGPLPNIRSSGFGKSRNSKEDPAEIWQRGEEVTIKWHRNNHGGGIVRMALVPEAKKNEWEWHNATAFEYSCFETGLYKCHGEDECGSDKKGYGYSQTVKIPAVFPDGDYVFNLVWYGGLDWTRDKSKYSDYRSASFIKIEGGDPVISSYSPEFKPGESPFGDVPARKCRTTSIWVGECGGAPCSRSPIESEPGNFLDGARPDDIQSSKVEEGLQG